MGSTKTCSNEPTFAGTWTKRESVAAVPYSHQEFIFFFVGNVLTSS